MPQVARPQFISYPEIRAIVENYAVQSGLEDVLPLDIERLVDNILGINVIPFDSLYRSFEINAFISNDFRKIYVDEYLYTNLEPQYRFTLAHELGHMILHGKWYRRLKIDSIDSYLKYVAAVSDEDYKLLETQANYFAGLFLIPSRPLASAFKEKTKEMARFISSRFKGVRDGPVHLFTFQGREKRKIPGYSGRSHRTKAEPPVQRPSYADQDQDREGRPGRYDPIRHAGIKVHRSYLSYRNPRGNPTKP